SRHADLGVRADRVGRRVAMGRAHRRRQRHPRAVARRLAAIRGGVLLVHPRDLRWRGTAATTGDDGAVRLRPARDTGFAAPRPGDRARSAIAAHGRLRARRRGGRPRGRRVRLRQGQRVSGLRRHRPFSGRARHGAAGRRRDDGRPDRRRARLYRALRHAVAGDEPVALRARVGHRPARPGISRGHRGCLATSLVARRRGMSLLDVRNLRKSFGGVHAVADVSFQLGTGEMLALIGPNGAGKSTCFDLLSGHLRADAGSVLLAGRDIVPLKPQLIWRLGMARTFQVPAIFASMTVRENVQMALISHHRAVWRFGRPADTLFRDEADALLAEVEMARQADRAVGVLAYGDLKRVELAIALAGSPRLLLMDEPTAGMAAAARLALIALARRLVRERGLAVLFTEHDMDVVFGAADRVLVMDRGVLIASGDPASVRQDQRVRDVYLGVD